MIGVADPPSAARVFGPRPPIGERPPRRVGLRAGNKNRVGVGRRLPGGWRVRSGEHAGADGDGIKGVPHPVSAEVIRSAARGREQSREVVQQSIRWMTERGRPGNETRRMDQDIARDEVVEVAGGDDGGVGLAGQDRAYLP